MLEDLNFQEMVLAAITDRTKCGLTAAFAGVRVSGVVVTWRFMGSCKWGYKSPNLGYNKSYPTYSPTRTTHEPPSRALGLRV